MAGKKGNNTVPGEPALADLSHWMGWSFSGRTAGTSLVLPTRVWPYRILYSLLKGRLLKRTAENDCAQWSSKSNKQNGNSLNYLCCTNTETTTTWRLETNKLKISGQLQSNVSFSHLRGTGTNLGVCLESPLKFSLFHWFSGATNHILLKSYPSFLAIPSGWSPRVWNGPRKESIM